MRLLVLILAILPIFAAGDVFGDLLGQELRAGVIDHIREKRQSHGPPQPSYRPYSQTPPQIKHLLQAQQARDPIVHLPPQPPPQLGPAHPAQPQYQSQAEVSQYRPNVQYSSQPQQPNYNSAGGGNAHYRQPSAPPVPQYRPAASNYPQQAAQPNYRTGYKQIPGPQGQEPQPHYSSRLPQELQNLLQIQANLPNSIPQGHGAQQGRRY